MRLDGRWGNEWDGTWLAGAEQRSAHRGAETPPGEDAVSEEGRSDVGLRIRWIYVIRGFVR